MLENIYGYKTIVKAMKISKFMICFETFKNTGLLNETSPYKVTAL